MDIEPKGKHDQSKIKDDSTWSKEKLEKDQTGNDELIKILEEEVEKIPAPAPKKEDE